MKRIFSYEEQLDGSIKLVHRLEHEESWKVVCGITRYVTRYSITTQISDDEIRDSMLEFIKEHKHQISGVIHELNESLKNVTKVYITKGASTGVNDINIQVMDDTPIIIGQIIIGPYECFFVPALFPTEFGDMSWSFDIRVFDEIARLLKISNEKLSRKRNKR